MAYLRHCWWSTTSGHCPSCSICCKEAVVSARVSWYIYSITLGVAFYNNGHFMRFHCRCKADQQQSVADDGVRQHLNPLHDRILRHPQDQFGAVLLGRILYGSSNESNKSVCVLIIHPQIAPEVRQASVETLHIKICYANARWATVSNSASKILHNHYHHQCVSSLPNRQRPQHHRQ